MTLASQIEKLRDYPEAAHDEFRVQLERIRDARKRLAPSGGRDLGSNTGDKGVDRSREFTPISRPTIVRTLVDL